MTTDVINGVPRKLLANCAAYMEGSASAKVRVWHDRLVALLSTARPVSDGGEREAKPGWGHWGVGDTVQYVSDGGFIHSRMTVGSDYLIHEAPDEFETMLVLDDDGDELSVLVGEFEWKARAAQPQQAVAGEHDPMRQLANTYKATAMMRVYEVRRLREALEQIVACDWTSSESATDFAISQTKGHMISKIKRIARAALSAHKTGEEE